MIVPAATALTMVKALQPRGCNRDIERWNRRANLIEEAAPQSKRRENEPKGWRTFILHYVAAPWPEKGAV
jgi:hypothetical protein